MPVQGFTRYRKWQFGYQGSNSSLLLTPVAATRALPYRGVPDVNPNWTYAEVDQGALHKIQAPYRTGLDATFPLAGPLAYNDLPYLLTGALEGVSTPTGAGTAKTWTYEPASLSSPDPLGFFTAQFGDDVGDPAGETPADWFQFPGSMLEQLTLEGPQDMGPLQVTANYRAAEARNSGSTDFPATGTVPTPGLTVDPSPVWVYLGDCELFINDTAGAIGTTKITNALHAMTLSVQNELDVKRWANGSNTRFSVQDYGRGEQMLRLELLFAKTAQTVGLLSEADKWNDNDPQSRFVELRFTCPTLAQAGIPYSFNVKAALRHITRADQEINNNTVVRLAGDIFYDAGLGYAIRAVVVNTLAAL